MTREPRSWRQLHLSQRRTAAPAARRGRVGLGGDHGPLDRPDRRVPQFADRWPCYDANYGGFATLIVGLIRLWLTNVSVLLGGAFAHDLDPRPRSGASIAKDA